MRRLAAFLPVFAQLVAYAIVFVAVSRRGSFVGLLALPAFIFSLPVLLAVSIADARRQTPAPRYRLMSWAIALVPPALCLVLESLVT